ncbi:hepcidin [Meles meles]|uniref:hepcidin n=1 Tax=Meles meles TaxID=9662 RepID=UPI001E69922D|nr:hepcidin [Meles meles]
MVLSTRIQAACLLFLLLASLASGSVLPHQTRQLTALQAQDTARAEAGLTPTLLRLRRDTHFPICLFCCNCCKRSKCGFCCKT